MTINNPLADNSVDLEDQELVLRARSGDRNALEDLVRRHQAWIYNIAVRMLYHPQDAEDATQEILIKVLTRLSSFAAAAGRENTYPNVNGDSQQSNEKRKAMIDLFISLSLT